MPGPIPNRAHIQKPRTSNGSPRLGMRGAKGIRTPDLLIANETRYQLRHSPMGGFSLAQRAVRVNSASHALAAYSPAACLFTRRSTPLQDSIEVDRLEVPSHRLHIQRHVSRSAGGTHRVNHAGYFLSGVEVRLGLYNPATRTTRSHGVAGGGYVHRLPLGGTSGLGGSLGSLDDVASAVSRSCLSGRDRLGGSRSRHSSGGHRRSSRRPLNRGGRLSHLLSPLSFSLLV